MAIITCAQLSILHNSFFFPPSRKAFLRPYIYHILQEALSSSEAQKQSQETSPSQGRWEHQNISSQDGSLEAKLFQIRRGIHSSLGFYFRRRFNDSDVLGSKVEHIVLLSPFQKHKDMWTPLACWVVLEFPDDQVMEATEKQVQVNCSTCLCGSLCFKDVPYSSAPAYSKEGIPEFLEEQVNAFPHRRLPLAFLWEQMAEHIHAAFLEKPPQRGFDVVLLRKTIQNVPRK